MLVSRLIVVTLAVLFLVCSAAADVPKLVSYQGRLTGATGIPLDTTVNLTFSVYTDTTGVNILWEETQENVVVTDGMFSVLLGSEKDLPESFFDGAMHGLTVAVGSDPEMLPPLPMVSVVYALRALVADSALAASVSPGSIDSTEIADGGISLADLGRGGTADGQVLKWSDKDTAWIPADDLEGTTGTAGGWTDLGDVVRQQTLTDRVVLGATTPLGKLHVQTDDADFPTLYLQDGARDICWQTGEHLQLGEWNGTTFEEHARLQNNGYLALGTDVALAHLHIQGESQNMVAGAISFDDIVVEDQDAVMGLYSNSAGSAGSALSLAEVDGTTGELVNKWGFARQTSGAGNRLRLTFGASPHPYDNTVAMTITPEGHVGIGDVTPDDAQFVVATMLDHAIVGNSYIMTGGDSCYGVTGFAGVGYPGYPVGVYGRASTGTGVLGVGDNDPGGHGVIGRGLTGVRGTAADEISSIGVLGEGANTAYSIGVYGKAGETASVGTGVKGESFVSTAIAVHAVSHGSNGRAVRGESLDDGSTAAGRGGWFSSASGYGRGVVGDCSGSQGYGVYAQATGLYGTGIYAIGGTSGRAATFRGNVQILSRGTGAAVMELGEGLDYAEGFNVSGDREIKPGMVLAIDTDNPGQLALADEAYDTRVAGIVAGANGLGSGVRLGTQGFDHDVALAGRVYCYAETSNGAISPGDLLTTSDVPGYAMKVDDYARAQGAILGKAMEPLAQGETGLILVLVTLQ
ncbi:MAG: hypothetical protein KKA42_01755 [candidate division Zixibacteria bacterium]|nr:hypothetical protein [candidate division Zixibacteria bacterium]